jgi:hypothetical protein
MAEEPGQIDPASLQDNKHALSIKLHEAREKAEIAEGEYLVARDELNTRLNIDIYYVSSSDGGALRDCMPALYSAWDAATREVADAQTALDSCNSASGCSSFSGKRKASDAICVSEFQSHEQTTLNNGIDHSPNRKKLCKLANSNTPRVAEAAMNSARNAVRQGGAVKQAALDNGITHKLDRQKLYNIVSNSKPRAAPGAMNSALDAVRQGIAFEQAALNNGITHQQDRKKLRNFAKSNTPKVAENAIDSVPEAVGQGVLSNVVLLANTLQLIP